MGKKIIILGAGLAGLTSAYHLQKRKKECIVFEKEKEIGGLVRSKKILGFTFDYAGHLLHFRNKKNFIFVKSLLGDNLVKHNRNASIYIFNRFVPFPFQTNLFALPKKIKEECFIGFVRAQNNRKELAHNFYDWIIKNLGEGIAKHFMLPYNNKFWTISPKDLTYEWAERFVILPSLKEVKKGMEKGYSRNIGYNSIFWYPKKGGISELSKALGKEVKNIFTDCEIKEIDLKNKTIKLFNGEKERFDVLLSTLPLPELSQIIVKIPPSIKFYFKKLRWNSILNINLGIDRRLEIPYHWIYFPEKEFPFFRVGFFHNFSHSLVPEEKSSLYIEIAYAQFNSIDKKNIVSRAIKDLVKAEILERNDKIIIKDINDIKYGYPVYDFNYQKARERILAYLYENNIISFGRYGSWRYMSMEDVIWDGENKADLLK